MSRFFQFENGGIVHLASVAAIVRGVGASWVAMVDGGGDIDLNPEEAVKLTEAVERYQEDVDDQNRHQAVRWQR